MKADGHVLSQRQSDLYCALREKYKKLLADYEHLKREHAQCYNCAAHLAKNPAFKQFLDETGKVRKLFTESEEP